MKRNSKKFKIRRKLPNITTVFIMILGLIIIYFIFQGQEAKAEWFNDNWMYRQRVDITNSGSAQTDFQVQLTVDTAALITEGKIQSDCDDIRITDINGRVLDYWIEPSTCDNSSTKIWTKAPSIPTSGATLYVYYGNPSVPTGSASSPTKVFIREISDLEGFWDHAITESYPDSGNTWYDLSGNSRNFNHSGTPSWTAADGFYFDGSVRFTGPSSSVFPQGSAARTVVVIAKPTSLGGYKHVFHYGTQSQYRSFGITAAGTSIATHTWSSSCNKGSWSSGVESHVVTTGIGSTQEIYKNGSSQGTCSSYALNTGGNESSQIGTRINPSEYWVGYIKQAQIYDRVLSSPEVSDLANNRAYATTNYAGKTLVRKYASTEPSVGSPTNEEQSPGPVAYWKFDEGADNTCSGGSNDTCDSTQNGNDGAKTGATWQSEDMCVSGKCLYFDGANDYVSYGTPASLDMATNDFTVEFWMKAPVPTSGTFQGLIGNGSSKGYRSYRSGANPQIRWALRGDITKAFTQATIVFDNTWHHAVWIVDRTNNLSIWYFDGVKDAIVADITGLGSIGSGTDFSIGRYDSPFEGLIDEVKIYPYARSAAQIKADYLSGSAGTGGSAASAVLGGKPQKWLSDGLVGYWKMDESSWGTPNCSDEIVLDSSGSGNNGKACPVTTGPDGGDAGKFGNAGDFDGGDDYVRVVDSASLDITNAITVEAWFRFDDTPADWDTIVAKGNQGSNDHMWMYYRSNRFNFELGNETTRWAQGFSITPTLGTWYHFVGTYDSATEKSNVYLNGVADTEETRAGFGTIGTNAYDLTIGKSSYTDLYYFPGVIDEVRVYNRALSSKEVRDLYNWAPGPVGYWKMDETSGTTVTNYGSCSDCNGTSANITSTIGKINRSYNMQPSTSDYWYVPTNSTLEVDQGFTVEAWAYHDVNVLDYGIIANNTVENQFNIYHSGTEINVLGLSLSSGGSVGINEWFHAVVTYDGTTYTLYLNGVAVGTDSSTGARNFSGCWVFGQEIDGAGSCTSGFDADQAWDGKIDEVRIYNYARTPKQIIEDMNAGHPAVGSPVGSALLYLKLDEGYGTTAYDSGYNGDNGDLIDGPSWINNAKFGKGIDLDGLNDRVQGFTSNPFEYTGDDLTLSIWVNQDSGETTSGYIISKPWNSSGQYNYQLILEGNDTLRFSLLGSSSWSTVTTDTLSTGTWTHLAVTVGGATSTVKIYKNGKVIKSDIHNITDWTPSSGDSNISLCIGSLYPYSGGWGGNTGFSFDGKIDEVKIYNFALTEDEIKLDYNRGTAVLLGAISTDSSGNPDWSSERAYCIPGDTTSCSAPVVEWKFDEKAGTSANDTSGNGNTGTLYNMEADDWRSSAGCIHGGCVNIDDTSDESIEAPHSAELNPPSLTVEGWFNLRDRSDRHILIVKWYGYSLEINSSGYPYFRLRDITPTDLVSTQALTWGQWHHIAASFDNTTKERKVYIDGKETASETASGTITYQSNAFRVGYSGNYMDGLADDVRVYDYARTPAQIAWDYNRGGPVGWWKFDENQGMTAYDASGNSNNGTLEASMTSGDWVEGKYNTALDLDGGDDYVSIGNPSELNITSEITLSAWLKTNEASGSKTVVSRGYAYMINAYYGSGIEFYAHDGTDGTGCSVSWDGGWTGNWIFLTTVIRPYTDGWTIKGYVNGVEKCSGTHSSFDGPRDTSESVYIGSLNGTGRYQNGQIDDVRIYNYALTQEQIKNVMNQGAAIRFGPSEGSP